MSDTNKSTLVKQYIDNIQSNLERLKSLIGDDDITQNITFDSILTEKMTDQENDSDRRVVYGTFDGKGMIGENGETYSMPANYASKSKLVEGDQLKLTINPDGSFIYKQIKPIDRKRVVGKVVQAEGQDEYMIMVEDKLYQVLLASITYYKGDVGDEVVCLVPTEGEANWAAVENIIKV